MGVCYESRCAQWQPGHPAGLIKDMEMEVLVSECERLREHPYVRVLLHTCEFIARVCVCVRGSELVGGGEAEVWPCRLDLGC